jgi:hypothetical protein
MIGGSTQSSATGIATTAASARNLPITICPIETGAVKRSWSDFLADFKKDHKHKDKKLAYFYYAVPISIGEKVFNYLYEGQYSCKPGFIYYNKSKVDGFTDKN